ncbi:helix-turn-helix domain-containing protein [Staphylococcus epidermidis]|uniref:helix-turn-helix domain-containing protein n=1 Tax=Staphylococcus epidermidis TaxID=1282 RepID=UPI000ADED8ED|nr:helix-turn-helix domain-containing protein [Staphylococcus epidermidis]QXU78859.1 helix-turn-helix domain-containing protein [Staphylococcus epidermidis]QXU78867.1 helix-turn-helix domain-containing protein [Staphylococcus epidermidis]QXU78884.1 helix-turn-helix domain-containing protein [Staphylococcus epidermidis]QXU81364.1 helix-turn-helix domain-containing protein [Staphylococcus epidermidis]QXU86375.1 helix-turn-helix domain-containing protein [Staphylococcus epidermidis]
MRIETYTVNEVAQLLDMNIRTVRKYIKIGEIKASKIGRKYIITSDNVKKFLENKEL